MTTTPASVAVPVDVHRLVPMAHVGDVERSIRFYALLGFEVGDRMADNGRTIWAWIASGPASLMLSAAGEPVRPEHQSILFYLHCSDVAAMRAHLLACGVTDGGAFRGGPAQSAHVPTVFQVTHPHHMPAGELRVHDPDGYCLLIGQQD